MIDEDDFWQVVKPKLMEKKRSSLDDYNKIATKAAHEYLEKSPEEPSGE